MAPDPLRPEAILQGMADALPTHPAGDTSSDLSSSYEALALFVHACMVCVDFRLVGFDEDHQMDDECAALAPRLPPKWNASFNSLSFLYAHTQSAMRFVVRVDRLGGKAEVRALGVGHDRIYRVELAVRDYVSAAALPVRIPTDPETKAEAEGARTDGRLTEKLTAVFISRERIADLAALLKVSIIQRIVPRLQKEGYEETSGEAAAGGGEDREGGGGSRGASPAAMPPAQPAQPPQPPMPRPGPGGVGIGPGNPGQAPRGDFPPPGFDDEYDINRPPGRGLGVGPGGVGPGGVGPGGVGPALPGGRSPYGIGHDDLYPPGMAPHDIWCPNYGTPYWPASPSGMYPTFGDPLFGGGGQGGGGVPSGGGPFPGQNPWGARWDDPYGQDPRRPGREPFMLSGRALREERARQAREAEEAAAAAAAEGRAPGPAGEGGAGGPGQPNRAGGQPGRGGLREGGGLQLGRGNNNNINNPRLGPFGGADII